MLVTNASNFIRGYDPQRKGTVETRRELEDHGTDAYL